MNILKQLSDQYAVRGSPKIAALITGGGTSWLMPTMYPGASRWLDSVIVPYERGSWDVFGFDPGDAKVDARTTVYLLEQLQQKHESEPLNYLVINAALTTDRYRSGDNRAWIALLRNGADRHEVVEVKFSKLSQDVHSEDCSDKRYTEDLEIGLIAWELLNNTLAQTGKMPNHWDYTNWTKI